MQKDFHYNMTLALAVKAGIDLETAKLIAWSNQFVDECSDFKKYGFRTMVKIAYNAIDCFVPEVQMNVFVPFHYLPGGKYSLVVKAESELAIQLVERAANSSNPIAFGMALHGYHDTFSHEGFTGTQDDNNAKHKWDKTGLSSLPPRIGHAEYGFDPDITNRIWTGPDGGVMNYTRFQKAANKTLNYLSCFMGYKQYKKLDSELTDFWSIRDYDQRKVWLMNWADIPTVFSYKNTHAGRTDKQKEQFVQAAKKQQSYVLDYLSTD